MVAALVETELHEGEPGSRGLVDRLRHLARRVLGSERDRHALQVLASGRRLPSDVVEFPRSRNAPA